MKHVSQTYDLQNLVKYSLLQLLILNEYQNQLSHHKEHFQEYSKKYFAYFLLASFLILFVWLYWYGVPVYYFLDWAYTVNLFLVHSVFP